MTSVESGSIRVYEKESQFCVFEMRRDDYGERTFEAKRVDSAYDESEMGYFGFKPVEMEKELEERGVFRFEGLPGRLGVRNVSPLSSFRFSLYL